MVVKNALKIFPEKRATTSIADYRGGKEDVDGDGEDVDVNGEDLDGEEVDADGNDVDGDGEEVDGDDANLGSRVLAEALGCP